MKREQRLRKNNDFQQLYREGFKVRGYGLVLYARPLLSPMHRMGIVISRKMGTAVVRNRWKRRMRTFFHAFSSSIPTPCDLVWIATHPQITQISFAELQTRVLQHLSQLAQKWPQVFSQKGSKI